jgi:pilus assembly protein CpaC
VQGPDTAFEVVVGQGRILNLKEDISVGGKTPPLIAVGDPTVIKLNVINPRQIRVLGERLGVTDLSITTAADKTYGFEVRVVLDLDTLRGQLCCLFPDAHLKLGQLREQVVVEGQARDTAQVERILETIRAYLLSVQISQLRQLSGAAGPQRLIPRAGPGEPDGTPPGKGEPVPPIPVEPLFPGAGAPGGPASAKSSVGPITVLNLIRVPTSQQVLLKVRVAELDRTALRQIGNDILAVNGPSGSIFGTQIGGATVAAAATVTDGVPLTGIATTAASPMTTAFGIFQEREFSLFLSALRSNTVLKVLAEPNLVAFNGQQASFLAGGEYPVPVPQFGGAGGAAATVTVQFKEFGVRLGFVPFILDGDLIRLTVDPEVSDIDFSIATTLVPGGSPVPGVTTRRTHTTVEMRQGQTLMISGLLQLEQTGTTRRIPVLGDLPLVGPFFSNTTSARTEKELVVMVTPYLVEPMRPGQVTPGPGDEVGEPNDLELYLLNRIESRTGEDFRSTAAWDDPLHIRELLHLESHHVCGPQGFAN